MKKTLIHKKLKKLKKIRLPKKGHKKHSTPSRITNETVAEHRERVISEGRRYKYPLQYARHKLVFNTLIISVAAIILLAIVGWWQLYIIQNTNTFFYRVAQVAALPVGTVDGQQVRYSDYMLYYRPSEHFLRNYDEVDLDSRDGKLQLEYVKRDAMNRAIADAQARRIASEQNLTVTSEEVDRATEVLKSADNGTLSNDEVRTSTEQVLGMTEDDIRTQYYNSLLRGKAAFSVDDTAREQSELVKRRVDDGQSLQDIAESLNREQANTVEYNRSGMVSRAVLFNGVFVSEIAAGERNKIIGPLKSTSADGYLFTKVVSSDDARVNFEYLFIPLRAFTAQIEQLREDGKVNEFITIDIEKYAAEE